MAKRVGMEVSLAISEAVKMANVDAIAAYPITPQTHIVERLADMVYDGELDAEYISVESEHSAMSACLGTAAVGARTFTSTASQGMELMHEVLFVASAMRLPIVMAVANRAISGPLSIWGDHSDVMEVRDTGWVQIFVENGQESFDQTICAFKIAEDPRVFLPTMVHLDGFNLSHVIEPHYFLEQAEVDAFLPPLNRPNVLDPDNPVTLGAFAPPTLFTEAKKAHHEALKNSKEVIKEIWAQFAEMTGRQYKPVETYKTEGAKVILMTMGSFGETASVAVDKMRSEGQEVGLVKLRLWRPFPFEEFRQAVQGAEVLVVLDRALSPGGPGGPVASEVKAALYAEKNAPKIAGVIAGLGGRDVSPENFEQIIRKGIEVAAAKPEEEFVLFGVRE